VLELPTIGIIYSKSIAIFTFKAEKTGATEVAISFISHKPCLIFHPARNERSHSPLKGSATKSLVGLTKKKMSEAGRPKSPRRSLKKIFLGYSKKMNFFGLAPRRLKLPFYSKKFIFLGWRLGDLSRHLIKKNEFFGLRLGDLSRHFIRCTPLRGSDFVPT
jgi:hypothetical protein